MEEFKIVRDKDWAQTIHPATKRAWKTAIPVKGPDNDGEGKNWIVKGTVGFEVHVELTIEPGVIRVMVQSEDSGARIWSSKDTGDWHDYDIVGTWGDWDFSPLLPCKG